MRKQGGPPKHIVTDKLGSSAAAKRLVMPNVEHRSHKRLNNHAENSTFPFENASEQCRAFDPGPNCSVPFQPSPPSATFSFRPAHAALLSHQPASPRRDGDTSRPQLPERRRRCLFAAANSLFDIARSSRTNILCPRDDDPHSVCAATGNSDRSCVRDQKISVRGSSISSGGRSATT